MRVAITGASSFTGRYVAEQLLSKGAEIVNLTNHPNRSWKIQSPKINNYPLTFTPEHLVQSLTGCDALVQTYWVRFDNTLGVDRQTVTDNSKMLIDCAKKAGVKKIVYTSHTQTSLDSPFPYIKEKAKIQKYLKQSGLGWNIVKPCAIFGRTPQQGIMLNNMAYLVRKFPFFPMPGDGNYPLQFVHAQDMADLIVTALHSDKDYQIDAVGPDKVTFKQIINHISKQLNTTCIPITGLNKKVTTYMTYPLNWWLNDILIDSNDLDLMITGLTCSKEEPTGKISVLKWIRENREQLGRKWCSSVERYYK